MKNHTSRLTANDQKYYDELKKNHRGFYTQAILNAECIAINHKLPLNISADIERNMVLMALDICQKIYREAENYKWQSMCDRSGMLEAIRKASQ